MRIVSYTESYASVTTTFIVNELKSIQEQHDLLLIYSKRENPAKNNLKLMLNIPYAPNKIINKIKWWLEQFQIYYSTYNPIFKRKVNKAISDFKPDIIHCHFGTSFLKILPNLNKHNKKIPILVSFYGFDVTERIKNKAVLKKYQKAFSLKNTYSIAVSDSLVKNINQLILPYNQAIILYSGINTEFFKRKNYVLNPKEFVFLQVSAFNFKKGHKYTLEAFKRFIDFNTAFKYKFIIAGYGPLELEIKEQIRVLNLEEYVQIRGAVTPSEMVDLASSVNCFVHMSITAPNGDQEGLPNVLLEAMSLELPIISTKHAGIPEIIIDGENGILCEEKNIEQYVEAFNRIINWGICPKNRDRIVSNFSMESHINYLNEIYNQICSTHKANLQ